LSLALAVPGDHWVAPKVERIWIKSRAMMTMPSLVPDCEHCAALCCVALAMDAGGQFAIDKPAGERCLNLDDCGRCRVHARLEVLGFGGCVQFDCLGAGQRVVADLFGGRSWLSEPELLEPMSHSFHLMRQVQDLHHLLDLASRWDLEPPEVSGLAQLRAELEPGWTRLTLQMEAVQALRDRVHGFLKTLAHHAKR
jgi:hypothetical protein